MYKFYTNILGMQHWHISKLFFIMRLTTIILLTTMIYASASTTAQTISISKTNATLIEVFSDISKQTDYDFFYSSKQLAEAKKVNINIKNGTINEVLDQCFREQPFSYTIKNKIITIKKKEPASEKKANRSRAITITGSVSDTLGKPLTSATIKVLGESTITRTNEQGNFTIRPDQNAGVLVISYIGYITQQINFSENNTGPLKVTLKEVESRLKEVEVVSTGYQNIPKERSTGAFTQINNSLINRSIGTNILERLNGVTSGLIFTQNNSIGVPRSSIEIRGRSTLFSNAEPLIILDNFPYDGDFANINPNDIENITILKDAAAASAWGARSGNGVIVITTKKGTLNSKPKISINTNINIGERPNLYYTPQLSSSEYIDVQQFLFDKGAYNSIINLGYMELPPAVEIFLKKRDETISESDFATQINTLKGYDVREQLLKYYYRPSINQQHQLNISGGNASQKYFVSAGYDQNQNQSINDGYKRVTVNANNTYYFLNNKIELFSGIIYSSSNMNIGTNINSTLKFPYSQLADNNGNALIVPNVLRPSYAETAGNGKLLNWLYNPLDEIRNNYNSPETVITDYRINTSLSYSIFNGFKASLFYNYQNGIRETSTLDEVGSFSTRNRINILSQINPTTGAVIYPLPLGGILSNSVRTTKSQNGRFQVNYNNLWGKHAVNAIAGTEIKDLTSYLTSVIFYGYDPETATNQNRAVNYTATFPNFYGSGSTQIAPGSQQNGSTDRFFSYYFNGSYTYADKYIASLSARRDESNLFGVATNQKGVPLWSAGLAWIIDKEDFYNFDAMPQLKLRATYGYTGNVNNSLSAYLTSQISSSAQAYNSVSAVIVNPPNPSLRWERIRNLNLGLDFGTKNNRLSGNIDYWRKAGFDLIGNSPIAPQTGIAIYTGNSASTVTKGIDVQLNSSNLNGFFKWYTTFLYNYSTSKVTDYKVSNGTNFNVVSANYNNPLVGYPFYSIFSFKYAGLDNSGNPQGYLNGEVSSDYTAIRNSSNRAELEFSGSVIPTSFGSLRNTFEYKGFDLSFNITYKFGYFFRRNSLTGSIYGTGGGNYFMPDYNNRWQNPGDELKTNVPALIYPNNLNRFSQYTYSTALVEKGDHIRLQDIRLGFTIGRRPKLPFNNINLFTYINNIGILWKANNHNIDPDFVTGIPTARTIAFGIKADL